MKIVSLNVVLESNTIIEHDKRTIKSGIKNMRKMMTEHVQEITEFYSNVKKMKS